VVKTEKTSAKERTNETKNNLHVLSLL